MCGLSLFETQIAGWHGVCCALSPSMKFKSAASQTVNELTNVCAMHSKTGNFGSKIHADVLMIAAAAAAVVPMLESVRVGGNGYIHLSLHCFLPSLFILPLSLSKRATHSGHVCAPLSSPK